MKLSKTETTLVEHARRVGYVTIRAAQTCFQRAASSLIKKGLLRHESSPPGHDTFSLTEAGRKHVFGYAD